MSCSCGCNVVEDYENETFCTACGSKISQAFLVSAKTNTWDIYRPQVHDWTKDVSDKYLSSGIFSNSKEVYILRQKKARRRNLQSLCSKMNLPNAHLIAETAESILERDYVQPRKHILMKHRAAAIYSSCKIHNIEITSSRIIEHLQLTGRHLSTFFLKFYKSCHSPSDLQLNLPCTEAHDEHFVLADFKDLEQNNVIPVGKADLYYRYCKDLCDVFALSRLSSRIKRKSMYKLGIFVDVIHLFVVGQKLDTNKLDHFGVRSGQSARFQVDVSRCWNVLFNACCHTLSWLLRNTPRSCQSGGGSLRIPAYKMHFTKRLDKILANKVSVMDFLKKNRRARYIGATKGTRLTKGRKSAPPSPPLPPLPSSLLLSSPSPPPLDLAEEDNVIELDVLNQCLQVLDKFISRHQYEDVIELFKRLLNILLFTNLKSHIIKIPKLVYFVLLHQIISALEHYIPHLSVLLKDKKKTNRMDRLIRLTYIKILLTHLAEMLPINLDKEKLLGTVHTYYYIISGNTYKTLLKKITQDNWLESPASSSASSPRSTYSDIILIPPVGLTQMISPVGLTQMPPEGVWVTEPGKELTALLDYQILPEGFTQSLEGSNSLQSVSVDNPNPVESHVDWNEGDSN